MRRLARLLFQLMLCPIWYSILTRRRLVGRNFHGCHMVLGRYPQNLPLLHRAVYSWWFMPVAIYDERVREGRRPLEYEAILKTSRAAMDGGKE